MVNPATHSNANGERADASTAKSTATVTATATKDTVPFPPKDKCRVLIVGCGSSRLGEDMMKDGWAWSGKNDDDGNGDGDEPQTAKQGGPGLGPGTGPSSGDNAHVNGKGNGKASARKSSKTATATTATKGKAMAKTTAGSTTVRRKGSESGKVQPPQGRGQGHRHPQVQVQQPHHRVHPSGGIVHVDFSPVVIAQRKERMHQMHDAFYRCIAQRKSRWMRGLPLSSLSLLPMMPKNDANANNNHHRARASTLQDIPEAREDEQDQEKEKDRNGSDSNGNGNGGGHGNDKGDGNCNRNRHSPTTTATGHSKTKRIDPNLSVPNTTVTTDAKQVNTGGIGTSNGTTNMSFIPPMTFECVDVTQQLPYPDDSFDLIVNKGTLDAILCSNGAISNANAMMEECARVLNPRHGKMVVVSYGSPENRRVYFENHKVGRSGSGDASASASGNGNALLGGSAKESSKNEIHTEKEKGPSETIEEGNGNEDEGEGEKVEKGEEEVAEDDDEKEWWGRGLQIFKVPKPKIDNVEFQNGGNPNKCHYVYVASK